MVMGLSTVILGPDLERGRRADRGDVVGIANLVYIIPTQTIFIEMTPIELMGRVVAFRSSLVFGAMTLAMAISGILAESIPAGMVIAAFGALTALGGLIGALLPAVRDPVIEPAVERARAARAAIIRADVHRTGRLRRLSRSPRRPCALLAHYRGCARSSCRCGTARRRRAADSERAANVPGRLEQTRMQLSNVDAQAERALVDAGQSRCAHGQCDGRSASQIASHRIRCACG